MLELLRTLDKTGLAPVILIGLVVAATVAGFGLHHLWFWYGPGNLQRRKQARRNLWFKVRFDANPEAPDLPYQDIGVQTRTVPRNPKLSVPDWLPFLKRRPSATSTVDREAFEREVRRWD